MEYIAQPQSSSISEHFDLISKYRKKVKTQLLLNTTRPWSQQSPRPSPWPCATELELWP